MKRILLLTAALFLLSCKEDNISEDEFQTIKIEGQDHEFQTIKIEGCEYLYEHTAYARTLTLKANGNCGCSKGKK